MIILAGTTDKLQLITNAAADVEVHCSWVDNASGLITPGRTNNTSILAAATTDIVPAPAAGTYRAIKYLSVLNHHATVSVTVEVYHTDGTNPCELISATLLAGEHLEFIDGSGWTRLNSQGIPMGSGMSLWTEAYSGGYVTSGLKAENFNRLYMPETNVAALTSGTLALSAIFLKAGTIVNSISFWSATTAAGTPTNQIFGLYDVNRNLLAQTTNDTTTAWAVNSIKTKALTAAYTIPADGLYYCGLLVTATTVPTFKGVTRTATSMSGAAPILNGNSTTGLTTTIPNPAAAINVSSNMIWCGVG